MRTLIYTYKSPPTSNGTYNNPNSTNSSSSSSNSAPSSNNNSNNKNSGESTRSGLNNNSNNNKAMMGDTWVKCIYTNTSAGAATANETSKLIKITLNKTTFSEITQLVASLFHIDANSVQLQCRENAGGVGNMAGNVVRIISDREWSFYMEEGLTKKGLPLFITENPSLSMSLHLMIDRSISIQPL